MDGNGRLVSFWEGLFSGAILVSGRVYWNISPIPKQAARLLNPKTCYQYYIPSKERENISHQTARSENHRLFQVPFTRWVLWIVTG